MSDSKTKLPSDLGMTGLGHVMRPAAGFALAVNAFLCIQAFSIPTKAFRFYAVAFLLSGLVRSWLHLDAGGQLAQTGPNALKAAARYCKFAIAQSLGMSLLALKYVPRMEATAAIAMFIALVAWPGTVYALSQRKAVRRAFSGWLEEDGPHLMPNDRGFQGAGLLMLIFGLMGCLFGLAYLIVILPSIGMMFQLGVGGVLTFLLLLASCARSVAHLRTGTFVLRADFERFASGVNRYLLWAVIWGICMLAVFFALAGMGGLAGMQVVVFILAVMTLWPGHLAGTVNVVQFWDDDDDDVPRGHAADGGLSAVGFALLAYGIFSLSFQVLTLMGGLGSWGAAFAGDDWTAWVVVAVTLWAGVEIALMTTRYKIAGLCYAGLGVGVGIFVIIDSLGALSSAMWMSQAVISGLVVLSLTIAFPAAVGWLVLRPLPVTEDIVSVFD